MPTIKDGYLARWSESVDSSHPLSPERLARAVATHLLDCGHSSGRLHGWVRSVGSNPDVTLVDLLRESCQVAEQEDRDFEVLIPFVAVPDHETLEAHLPERRSPSQAAAWFAEQNIPDPPRQNGAFVYHFTVKDAVAAASEAGRLVRRLDARRSYSRRAKKRLVPVGRVWIAGRKDSLPLTPPDRGASILSLVSEQTMYAVSHSDKLDEALELAAPLNTGSVATAAAGGWAAIESLLFNPGDQADIDDGRAVVADRLAAVVACSWPRAELTALSYRYQPPEPDEITRRLSDCQDNMTRSKVIAEALQEGSPLPVSSPREEAARERMRGSWPTGHSVGEVGRGRLCYCIAWRRSASASRLGARGLAVRKVQDVPPPGG